MNFSPLNSGKSVEGQEIKAYRSETKAKKYIYLMAGVHGDEVEGIHVLKELISWLETQDLNIPIIHIPVLNVDGHRNGTRVNSNGVDLNRNLSASTWSNKASEEKYYPGASALSEPENKFFVKLLDKFPPKMIYSFHSWKPVINYNGDCKEVAEFLSKFNNYPPTPDIGYPTPGSLGSFGPEQYNAPVITFECPLLSDGLGLKEIWEQNQKAFQQLFLSDLI